MFPIIKKALELEREGKTIIHFELGDPDFNTPENIINASYTSLKKLERYYVHEIFLRGSGKFVILRYANSSVKNIEGMSYSLKQNTQNLCYPVNIS